MKNLEHYILALLTALVFVGCADEANDLPDQDIEFCVRAAWQDGLSGGTRTRALSTTDLLADGTADINIAFGDYPTTIEVTCKKGDEVIKEFTLTKGDAKCPDHTDAITGANYWKYTPTPSFFFRDQLIRRENYTFYATAVIDDDNNPATTDDGDRLEGTATKDNIVGKHLKLTLHHTKALLRFAFKVDQRYDKVRKILVTGIKLNNVSDPEHPIPVPLTIEKKILSKDNLTYIAYAYVDPKVITTSIPLNIQCTYSIYDNDTNFPTGKLTDSQIDEKTEHLTRSGIVASNSFNFGSLKKADGKTSVTSIEKGYYYDLRATLNPDYLYVLSEHDNQHLKIE